MADLDIYKEIMRAIVGVARHKEFYGHIVQQFEKVVVSGDHPLKTAAVGRRPGEKFIKLYMNTDYLERIYSECLQSGPPGPSVLKDFRVRVSGVVEHEILHVVFGHLTRWDDFPDKDRYGIAVDCVVNPCIPGARRGQNWALPSLYGLPNNQTSKWYYDNLKNNDNLNLCGEGVGVNSHELWPDLSGDIVARSFVRDIVRKARENTTSEGWGEVSDNIKEAVGDLLSVKPPQIPWSTILREFCASASESVLDYTMSRISRRFGSRPGTRKLDVLNLAVIVDTSASISKNQLVEFFNEIRWIWRNGSEVTVFEADTKVQRKYSFRGHFDAEVCGRGGTELEPALVAVDRGHFDAAVYFTDFCAPKISRKFRFPVLWVLSDEPPEDRWPCQWGRVVKIKTKEDAA